MAGDLVLPARARLAALSEALRRHELPMAAELELVQGGSDDELEAFLTSVELWGRTGSIVDRASVARSGEARREIEAAFTALGEWQLGHERATSDIRDWVGFFSRHGSSGGSTEEGTVQGGPVGEAAVPWGLRDVWLGVFAAVLIVGATFAFAYGLDASSIELDVDVVVALLTIGFEMLFLIPVWWFAVRKYRASLKTLGFVRFRPVVVAIGVGLLIAINFFNGLYGILLEQFGLRMENDLVPVAERLSSPWLLAVGVVVVAPVVEETLFRGFVFAGLRSRYGWRWAGVISAALFAAIHLDLIFFIPAFLLGYLFAYLYQSSGSIWPGVIVHALTNALAVTLLYVQI